ncbi:hypothetical protein BCR33DRAFT_693079 [Rhizoclosmatium globosum]|uniref:2Fe-2S ferredoxin-type domain-containing protein n=1 Tax=Rhizoclosmatium globosum TaxID=329046 RepID=A0A1Y2D3A3_9FUNG|nr:hypothetical protein BCR33DRAFT_693079 [Rhizoclosmatium globosum]|eukprot:ORY53596.1 hypothetical protein BCR33DRAFT_693079 [Rhizoclosmatium globosum]
MLRFRKVGLDKQSFDLVVRYLVESRLGVFDKVPLNEKELKVEKLQEDGVLLVCAHDQVDTRCGERGTRLMEGLAEAAKDSSKKYSILPTSHIGGHDFAANLISYPRGDFYGNLAQTPSFSAKHVLSAIESNTVLWDHWRGRVGLDANTTKRMALAKKDADQLEKSGCGSKTVEGKGLGTGETIKVTYVLANGQRIEVDAELTEFNPADPEQPYFPSENDKAPTGGSLPPKRDNEVDFYFQLGSETRPIRAKVGENLMHIARDHKIPTIDAVCGGEMECATCHVIVGKEHFAKLPKATEGEEDMLEYAIGRKDCSRLSCQLKVTKEMEGMEVKVHMPPGSEIFI